MRETPPSISYTLIAGDAFPAKLGGRQGPDRLLLEFHRLLLELTPLTPNFGDEDLDCLLGQLHRTGSELKGLRLRYDGVCA